MSVDDEAPQSQITVCVRVRPLSDEERAQGCRSLVTCDSSRVCLSKQQKNDGVLFSERAAQHDFQFDHVFDPDATQLDVFTRSTAGVVADLVQGRTRTACVFAYGATGSGKSHSMLGDEKDAAGILPRALTLLFARVAPEATVHVSYLEIYNEQIFDLLSSTQDKPLTPCEQPDDGSVRILGLSSARVADVHSALRLVAEGNLRRKTEATAANQVSSRSHAVFQIELHHRGAPHARRGGLTEVDGNAPPPAKRRLSASGGGGGGFKSAVRDDDASARLTLVDLAGSERAAATQNRGARLREGAAINKSLLALANAINALSTPGERTKFRDSKLTHLLKASLVGNCRVVMLATLSPSHKAFEESLNTLKYADRAKRIPVAKPIVVAPVTPAASLRRAVLPTPAPPSPSPTPAKTTPTTASIKTALRAAAPASRADATERQLRAEMEGLRQRLKQVERERDVLASLAKPTRLRVPSSSTTPAAAHAARFVPVINVDLTRVSAGIQAL